MARGLDFRHIVLADIPIVAVPTTRAALAMARARGYPADAVHQAYNRFWRFWIIGQWITYGHEIRCAATTVGASCVIRLRQAETASAE